MESTIGRNMFNCSLRYGTSLTDILDMQFQSRDILSRVNSNTDSSILSLLHPLTELLHCRDGSLNLSSDDFCMADVSFMIFSLCTYQI